MTNPEIMPEIQEQAKDFHFEEIAEIEPAMTSLVEQMKEKIENGEYDTLISDDVGGRIPTLILRRIMKDINPNKKVDTYFIAGGKYLPIDNQEKYQQLLDHLKRIASKTRKALVVTQFVYTGKTIINLADALKEAGAKNFDVAIAEAMPYPHFKKEELPMGLGPDNQYFIGNQGKSKIREEHEHLSGVLKSSREYSPYPKRASEIFLKEGKDLSPQFDGIFEIGKEYERIDQPLSEEEKAKIQQNVNFARADVNLLAERIIKKVWNK